MAEIPRQFRTRYKFVLIRPKDKIPIEAGWQKDANYSYNHPKIKAHVGNLGILTGDGLIIIDCDCQGMENIAKWFSPTLVIGTSTTPDGYRKKHYYFRCSLQDKKVLKDYDKHLGEIQAKGQQCLIPPSVHPSGAKYEVIEDRPIAELSEELLLKMIRPFVADEKKTKRTEAIGKEIDPQCAEIKKRVKIPDLLRKYGFNADKNPTKCLWHESQGGQCFSFDNDLWHCFHCERGGNVFHLMMEHEGISFTEAKKKLAEMSGIKGEITGEYFDGKTFISKWLGDEILQNNLLKTTTDNETVFSYQDGIWLPNGENIIKTEANKRLGQDSTTHRAFETIAYIQCSTFIDREEFNKDPYLLALENGVLNVKKLKLKPHDSEYMITVKVPLTYDPEAKCPLFDKFLSEIVDKSDIPLIYELFGWCLVRNYEIQKMVMFLGSGANGKSTLLDTLKAFLGAKNTTNISPQNLSERTFSPAQLHGKLANLYNDVPSKSLRETGILKQLCGQDSITVEEKFKNPFSFENYAKLLFACNKLPLAWDDSDAWFRRWTFVNFPNVFNEKNRDKGLLKKLTTPQELSGILNKVLCGIARIEKDGAFTNSESTTALREKYLRLANPVAAFCMDCIDEDIDSYIPKSELFGHYVDYCRKNKLLVVSQDVFAKRIVMIVKTKSERLTILEKRVYCWNGIMLKNGNKNTKPKDSKQKTLEKEVSGVSGVSG